ncbi:MAG: hypothetical protein ACKV2O_23065 [Acidimicrobiales bacterium]
MARAQEVMGLQTEFDFTLPKGFVDRQGGLHREGTMRLATARDELEPLRDARVEGPEDPYLTIVVLARVITNLGELPEITPSVVEGLFAADLAFLQDVYGIINFGDPGDLAELQQSVLQYAGHPEATETAHTIDTDEVLSLDHNDLAEADSHMISPDEDMIEVGVARRRAIEEVGIRH